MFSMQEIKNEIPECRKDSIEDQIDMNILESIRESKISNSCFQKIA